ncbi:MAG: AAA family ATPase, partial [Anaerolineales bacterium]|nr:AAA family ATPase [Anaerolineales bacterium]
MKLIEAHATNYRNIIDADPVEIGQTTCLVGKNEAGKSAFLKALEGIPSTDPNFNEYGKITNYPRRMLSAYESDHGDGQARVMRTKWTLEPADVAAIAAVFGGEALSGGEIT